MSISCDFCPLHIVLFLYLSVPVIPPCLSICLPGLQCPISISLCPHYVVLRVSILDYFVLSSSYIFFPPTYLFLFLYLFCPRQMSNSLTFLSGLLCPIFVPFIHITLACWCTMLSTLYCPVSAFFSQLFSLVSSPFCRHCKSCFWHLSQALVVLFCFCPRAGIMEADGHQVTTVFTVQPSFHHRHSTNQYHEALPSSANNEVRCD